MEGCDVLLPALAGSRQGISLLAGVTESRLLCRAASLGNCCSKSSRMVRDAPRKMRGFGPGASRGEHRENLGPLLRQEPGRRPPLRPRSRAAFSPARIGAFEFGEGALPDSRPVCGRRESGDRLARDSSNNSSGLAKSRGKSSTCVQVDSVKKHRPALSNSVRVLVPWKVASRLNRSQRQAQPCVDL
jgi:hypothetical protein